MGKTDISMLFGLVLSIVFVGILVAVSLLIFTQIGLASSTSVTVATENFTMPRMGGANTTFGGTNVTTFTSILNQTGGALDPSNYSIDTLNGAVQLLDNATGVCIDAVTCNANYVWLNYQSVTRTSTDGSGSAIAPVTTTWLGIVVTIAVLSLILGLVLLAFGTVGRRQ